jgi:hypothetical protein
MYGKTDGKPCWEVEGTLCNSLGFELMKDEMEGETIKEYSHASQSADMRSRYSLHGLKRIFPKK